MQSLQEIILCNGCGKLADKIAKKVNATVVNNCDTKIEGFYAVIGCPALDTSNLLDYDVVDLNMIESKFDNPEKVAIAWINSCLIKPEYETEVIEVGEDVVYFGDNLDLIFELNHAANITVVTKNKKTIKNLYPFKIKTISGEIRKVDGKIGNFDVYIDGIDLASGKRINKIKASVVILPEGLVNEKVGIYTYGNEYKAALKALNNLGKVIKIKTVEVNNDICGAIKSNIEGCNLCLACPTGSIERNERGISINSESCVGCGFCSSICPISAIQNKLIPSDLLIKKIDAVSNKNNVIAFVCQRALGDFYIYEGKFPSLLPIVVPCINSVSEVHYLYALCNSEGVIAVPCDCKYLKLDCFEIAKATLEAFGFGGLKLAKVDEIKEAFKEIKKERKPKVSVKVEGKNKREAWLRIVEGLSSFPLVKEKFHLHSFGKIEIDENCSLCQTCSFFCPSEAITRDVDAGKIRFMHGLCIGCELCMKACPENAIKIEKILDFSSLAEKTIFEDEMIKCIYCGKPFMSKNAYEKVRKASKLDKTLLFCPECRPKAILESLYNEIIKEEKQGD
ncbi:MAG: 4Fe-4S binding protein [Archaeoglobaceae archaeon]|nr:4Fe-4S binding protein [Archaeoglobaceae archaeon]